MYLLKMIVRYAFLYSCNPPLQNNTATLPKLTLEKKISFNHSVVGAYHLPLH